MKKIGSLCLVLVMLICNISVVKAESINDESVFIKQTGGDWCTYAAATNMLRRRALLDNNSMWSSFTDTDVRNTSRASTGGMSNIFKYSGYSVIAEDWSNKSVEQKKSSLESMLLNHPEGIVIYTFGGTYRHAVLACNFTDGTIYVADPAKSMPSGIIKLTDAKFNGSSQNDRIDWIKKVWYINTPACSHIYTDPNTEKCNKCGQKFQRIENSENKKYIVNVEKINLKSVPYSKIGNSNGVAYAGEVVTSSANVTNMYGNKWVKITNSKGDVGYTCIDNLKEYNPPKNSEINIDLTSYPTSLKQGSNFGLRGTISSANGLKRIEGFIKKGNDTVQSTTDYPNKTSVNVKGINLNKNLIFDNLGTGDYTLIVSATDSTGKTVTVKKNFSVYAEQTRADSSLSINLTRYPVTLDAGTSFGLRGSVDSNYSIARVRGYVKDSNGSVVLSSNDTPGSTSMNIQYADLNNSLVFNRLSPGSYTMIVEATDTSGRVVTATKDFSVRSKETYTDNSSSGSVVDGTVQIPSSWDDLSIRTGPSTDYTIVGSMPQGARCTVYPDRTVNGWYYVNYNGIWGYASGRQINLNSGGSAPSNTRVGIINIPSSWDDLSIRTGPSTDYTIVGSMPQGARCTVYPDKASGGWYYVEYNGVQGYAAGNRINLQ